MRRRNPCTVHMKELKKINKRMDYLNNMPCGYVDKKAQEDEVFDLILQQNALNEDINNGCMNFDTM